LALVRMAKNTSAPSAENSLATDLAEIRVSNTESRCAPYLNRLQQQNPDEDIYLGIAMRRGRLGGTPKCFVPQAHMPSITGISSVPASLRK
jgi:hypothetical protein